MSHRVARLSALSLLALLAPMPIAAQINVQTNVQIAPQQPATTLATGFTGTVMDPLGRAVANAHVELISKGKTVAAVDADGQGLYAGLTPPQRGLYAIRASAPSFGPAEVQVPFRPGTTPTVVDITLTTPTLTQQVTVTASGTPIPEAQTGASITVMPAEDYRLTLEVQDPLRLVPGLQVTQSGEMGGTTGLSIRGGSTDANKVLIDGVPANAIGGGVEFANIASVGIGSIEVLREPNSALYGSDALAGVVNMTSMRGSTPLPLFTYSGDAGNFHTYRNELTAGTVYRQFDLYSAFARIDTDNNIPNSEFHNATFAGNFGWTPNPSNDLRFTVRHLVVSGGQPYAIALYGIPDDGQQTERDDYYHAAWNNQTTPRWHNQIRYGALRQNGLYTEFAATGIYDPNSGDYDGAPATITGANGYRVTGQALFEFPPFPSTSLSATDRDFADAQTDYYLMPHLVVLGAFKYEHESGSSVSSGYPPNSIQRGDYSYTLQISGDGRHRLFYSLGTGLEDNGLFGFAATPRASLAYYLLKGTKLHGSFGKGIKEPSVYDQSYSLYDLLASLPNAPNMPTGSQLISQYHVTQLGAEYSRTFDGGVDQQFSNGRGRLGLTYFHNEFTNGVEFVPQQGLLALNIAAANLPRIANNGGAFLNSLAFRSQGIEVESEYRFSNRLFARGGYTYTDAVVQRSFDSDNLGCTPPGNLSGCTFNPSSNFANIPIGADSPLVGARPFRIAPHTGYFALNYTRPKFYATLTGTLVGRRDDSDFLLDSNFGTSLLLPNRNLDGSYQRLELGGGYQVTPRVSIYTNIQNLLSEHYFEAFGYPALPLTFRSGIKVNFGGESWKLK